MRTSQQIKNCKKWVAALRSGDYKQGNHNLKTVNNEYCCLGIACELAIKDGVNINVECHSESEYEDGRYIFDGLGSTVPKSVMAWLGLYNDLGKYITGTITYDSLASLNDNGTPFEEIADIIESEPKGLFV